MDNEYKKGAEWRKWDLHVHTPSSHDYKDNSVSDEDIINVLSDNKISLVAITDHHIIDIERIKNLQKLGAKIGITVLPGIEFLSDARGEEHVHFIGIFSENCNLSYIWGQIKNTTEIKQIEGNSKEANEVYCNLTKTAELIVELGGIVTIHAGAKSNTIENITHALPHSAAQKEDIAKAINVFELGKEKDVAEYRSIVVDFLRKKFNITHPLILCSDNHNIREYKLKVNCWIKADPTFEGLKQILNEPDDRVFIGEKPLILNRVSNNRTKYISELNISHIDGYDDKYGKWFDNISISLNKELVAIIGHKGSGKSAIADIISLCSNYHNNDGFSFLTSKKFREGNGKIASNFKASLIWESGYKVPKGLNDTSEATEGKGVKYLPQGQFERLTNEIATASEFQKEKEKIVGDENKLETIKYYQKEKKYLNDDIETELNGKYDERRNTARDIFKKKQEVIAIYKDVKSRISYIINENADNLKKYKIEIDASLVKHTEFNTFFFSFINHRQMGTYFSKEGAETELLKIISDINFDDEDSVISFLNDLTVSLRNDKREKQENAERLVNEQVQDVSGLYNYLFKLEFVDFNYQLKQGDKGIEQLSPGERGALLLVFYLLLDKNDIPLIIDQPEDNLDNHSVAKILVPFIRVAKARRQIIMVTHNPNLAVVADAEQIIYVNLDKEDNYSFSTIAGSIENKAVNEKIVEVLEGAMPAFNKRKDKYYE